MRGHYTESNLNVLNAFASNMFMFENKSLVKPLIKLIYSKKIKGVDSDIAVDCKHNLAESKFDFLNENKLIINKTKDWFKKCITESINYLYEEQKGYDIIISESWFHITKKNGHHETHTHPNCSWCGIYYLDLGDRETGHTIFESPITHSYLDYGNERIPSIIKASPENGSLILFPAHLAHSQSMYKGDKDRVVIGFNSVIMPENERK